jgi:hypothetical protein
MFKVLVLQHLHNLSDNESEYQVWDRLSLWISSAARSSAGKSPKKKARPSQGDRARYLSARRGTAPSTYPAFRQRRPDEGATMLATQQGLGVMPSFSRPAVSNHNPYSKSLFKTLKCRSRIRSVPLKLFGDLAAAPAMGERPVGLVQPRTPPQRDSVCNPIPTPRWPRRALSVTIMLR